MKLDCFEEVKRLTSEMVAIPSINKEPHGETAVAATCTTISWICPISRPIRSR